MFRRPQWTRSNPSPGLIPLGGPSVSNLPPCQNQRAKPKPNHSHIYTAKCYSQYLYNQSAVIIFAGDRPLKPVLFILISFQNQQSGTMFFCIVFLLSFFQNHQKVIRRNHKIKYKGILRRFAFRMNEKTEQKHNQALLFPHWTMPKTNICDR